MVPFDPLPSKKGPAAGSIRARSSYFGSSYVVRMVEAEPDIARQLGVWHAGVEPAVARPPQHRRSPWTKVRAESRSANIAAITPRDRRDIARFTNGHLACARPVRGATRLKTPATTMSATSQSPIGSRPRLRNSHNTESFQHSYSLTVWVRHLSPK